MVNLLVIVWEAYKEQQTSSSRASHAAGSSRSELCGLALNNVNAFACVLWVALCATPLGDRTEEVHALTLPQWKPQSVRYVVAALWQLDALDS